MQVHVRAEDGLDVGFDPGPKGLVRAADAFQARPERNPVRALDNVDDCLPVQPAFRRGSRQARDDCNKNATEFIHISLLQILDTAMILCRVRCSDPSEFYSKKGLSILNHIEGRVFALKKIRFF